MGDRCFLEHEAMVSLSLSVGGHVSQPVYRGHPLECLSFMGRCCMLRLVIPMTAKGTQHIYKESFDDLGLVCCIWMELTFIQEVHHC